MSSAQLHADLPLLIPREEPALTTADLWALLLMLAGGLLVWSLAGRSAERPDIRFLQRVVAATFALRAAWSVFQHIVYPPAWAMVAADARARYVWAVRDAQLWHDGVWMPHLPQTLTETHSMLVNLKTTALIYIFGPSAMLPEAFVITLNVSICIAIYLICRHVRATREATRAAVVFGAFLPSLIFWSTQDLKDPVTATCIAWAVLAMLKVGERAHGGYLLLLIAADFAAVVYRPYVGILLITGQGLAAAYSLRLPPTALGRLARVTLFALMTPIALHFGVQEMQSTYGTGMDLQWAVDSFGIFRESGIAGGVRGSEYAIPLNASTPTQAILQLPVRVALLLLSPIPLFPGTLVRMLVYPEMWFVYLFIAPRFGVGVREAWRKNRPALLAILLIVAPIIMSYALKTAVSGEAIRMRSQFMPILLIFAGIGHAVMARRRAERKQRRGTGNAVVTHDKPRAQAGT